MNGRLLQRNRRRGFGEAPDPSELLPRGSQIQWDGVIAGDATSTEGLYYLGFSPGRIDTLTRRLKAAGFDTFVNWEFESLGLTAGYFRIILTATTPVAYARAADAYSVLNGIVWDVYGNQPGDVHANVLSVPYVDPVTKKLTSPAAPNVVLPNDAAARNPQQICNWDSQSISEYIACQMGFSSTTTATAVMVGAALLVGILIMKK